MRLMELGICFNTAFLDHRTAEGHPERPERAKAIYQSLDEAGLLNRAETLQGRMATTAEVQLIHSPDYIARMESACLNNKSYLDTMDVSICPESFDTALLSCGAGLSLADKIMSGSLKRGFAINRPPGHHAEHNQAMGFCLLNNISVLAAYLRQQYNLERIAVIDWDVHHGNGTQHLFEDNPDVFFCSLHEFPLYPGTGSKNECGKGKGKGATLNIPMAAGSIDADYMDAFKELVLPALRRFRPEILLISAGFDAHANDPLSNTRLSSGAYGWMTAELMNIAREFCGGRIISLLEGGYNLDAICASAREHVKSLSA